MLITTKQYKKRVHTSTKLTPIQVSLKKIEVFVYQNLLDKQKRVEPKFQVKDFLRAADLKRTFSKGDTTDWSYKLNVITQIVHYTMPRYHTDYFLEPYNEALLK